MYALDSGDVRWSEGLSEVSPKPLDYEVHQQRQLNYANAILLARINRRILSRTSYLLRINERESHLLGDSALSSEKEACNNYSIGHISICRPYKNERDTIFVDIL